MKILIDSREQLRLEFSLSHPYIDNIIVKKLDVGDYSAKFNDGYIVPIVFERKSMGDLFGTMTSGYKRFKKEIIRSQENKQTLIIIVEGTLTDVLKGYKHSKVSGISIVKKLFTLWVKYGIMTVWVKNRKEMLLFITEFYCACGKQHVRRKNEST